MKCRHCQSELSDQFLDLGFQPPSNAYLSKVDLNKPEITFPLRLRVCRVCWLVQTEDYASETAFFNADYAYFSSTSSTWLEHARLYCDQMEARFHLDAQSQVVEVASNDGYLLKNFIKKGIPCIGIEPTASTAAAAEKIGIPVIRAFFGSALANELVRDGKQADLIVGNNVYAHVPDINDFTRGLAALLKPNGVITLEFPHLMRLVDYNQFDTVYHEHFSYLSLTAVSRIFDRYGLRVFDVEELTTHGGSLRVYGCKRSASYGVAPSVETVLKAEVEAGMHTLAYYTSFQAKVDSIKNDLLQFLLKAKKEGRKIAAYGAAAKGNTLLNYAGVKPDLLPFVCDASEAKQQKYLPGSHIPIKEPKALFEYAPDLVLVLPWNIMDEVVEAIKPGCPPNTKFVRAIPKLSVE